MDANNIIETLKPVFFIIVPILCWLVFGAIVAYTAQGIEDRKKKKKPRFEE